MNEEPEIKIVDYLNGHWEELLEMRNGFYTLSKLPNWDNELAEEMTEQIDDILEIISEDNPNSANLQMRCTFIRGVALAWQTTLHLGTYKSSGIRDACNYSTRVGIADRAMRLVQDVFKVVA